MQEGPKRRCERTRSPGQHAMVAEGEGEQRGDPERLERSESESAADWGNEVPAFCLRGGYSPRQARPETRRRGRRQDAVETSKMGLSQEGPSFPPSLFRVNRGIFTKKETTKRFSLCPETCGTV
ncbi:hypothetical protein GE061_009016 [Apolygus lucorum]|uniref:Uncharacterized protein n=1 Tax=Apolygus lucorum TaxID=248454 RepID=A0A6A4KGS1_APOLU|nr:hypothetical protein GE061_009016 [Apolygus lucorum]